MPSAPLRLTVAAVVATVAFWAYSSTLVPGVEPGDSAGFQAAVLWPETSARQAYPLYYAVARPFVRAVSRDNPARGLNLFSAVVGALAVGVLTAATAAATQSTPAGIVAGLLLTFSYTFWSQAIIAEVYTLHLLLIGLCLLALQAYARDPRLSRLSIVLAIYALAFGNHLSTILLLPALVLFVAHSTPEPRCLLRPHVIGLAMLIAAVGALAYLPNLLAIWFSPDAPPTLRERLAAFWFDVTKSDWRESMVLGVTPSQQADRVAMWWFDLRQQFGVLGVLLATIGGVLLMRRSRTWGLSVLAAWIACTAFALTYNVGDAHVFFLPSHYLTALMAGAAVMLPKQRRHTIALALAMIAYSGWRSWDTWPLLDRHTDRRAEQLITRTAVGLSEESTLVTQLDWQLENVLLYQTRFGGMTVPWRRLPDLMLGWPYYVQETHRQGRDVVLNDTATRTVVATYGAAFPVVQDSMPPSMSLADAVARLPRGTPYVLTVLPPPRDMVLPPEALDAAVLTLTGGPEPALRTGAYRVLAGLAGERPSYARGDDRPFRDSFTLVSDPFTVRMESWVATDTLRRAGFGHVLRARERVLIIERGVSLVSFAPDGRAREPVYIASLYTLRPRFRISAGAPQLARAEP